MNMKIEVLPACRIAFVRQIGPYGPANKKAMESLKYWAKQNELLTESATLLGIAQDNPQTTTPELCRYDACIVISQAICVDNSISEGELTSGEYAIFKVRHTAKAIQEAWVHIFSDLHAHQYQLD